MNKFAWVLCVLLVVQGFAFAADAPATRPATQPVTVTGQIGVGHTYPETPRARGYTGLLFVRSQDRWDQINKLIPDLKPITPLPKLDFAKQSAVLIYADNRASTRDAFTLTRSDLTASPPELDFSLSTGFDPVHVALPPHYAKFILAVIPTNPAVKVTVETTVMPPGGHQPEFLEYSAILGGQDGGDVVDGLQAVITPKSATIKSGDDIVIDFALHLADPGDAKPVTFANRKGVFIPDGEFFEGYCNHAFSVTTPDGKTATLRPKAKDGVEQTPRPVAITAKQLYHLEGGNSLKELGLDTAAPGTYTITGVYEETGRIDAATPRWGGSIASNTITVEVKK